MIPVPFIVQQIRRLEMCPRLLEHPLFQKRLFKCYYKFLVVSWSVEKDIPTMVMMACDQSRQIPLQGKELAWKALPTNSEVAMTIFIRVKFRWT